MINHLQKQSPVVQRPLKKVRAHARGPKEIHWNHASDAPWELRGHAQTGGAVQGRNDMSAAEGVSG